MLYNQKRIEFCSDDDNKKYHKVRDHCNYTEKYGGAVPYICNLTYKTPKEISVIVHNGSTYDNNFIIKELAKEFEGKFEWFVENTEKYINNGEKLIMVKQLHTN